MGYITFKVSQIYNLALDLKIKLTFSVFCCHFEYWYRNYSKKKYQICLNVLILAYNKAYICIYV